MCTSWGQGKCEVGTGGCPGRWLRSLALGLSSQLQRYGHAWEPCLDSQRPALSQPQLTKITRQEESYPEKAPTPGSCPWSWLGVLDRVLGEPGCTGRGRQAVS